MDNPNPGDTLFPGGYVVSGIAFDPSVSVGSGISRVEFFLGSRDEGGLLLGSAVPLAVPDGPARFQTQITVPRSLAATSIDFVAYAYADSNPGQTSVAVPVRLGESTAPTPATFGTPQATPTTRVTSNCGAVATAVSLAPPLPAEIASTPTPGPQLVGLPQPAAGAPLADAPGPLFELSNPNRGDVLPIGGYIVSGIAYDPASQAGPGVDRVEFFLDPREDGGLLLGSAVPRAAASGLPPTFSATIVIPRTAGRGAHVFAAYARSSVIGAEAIVQVPIFIGSVPTEIPR
jgi:hypothetical protein